MSANQQRVPIRGSHRDPVPGARSTGSVPRNERFEVTVRVRRKTALQNLNVSGVLEDVLPTKRRYLGRERYIEDGAADPEEIGKVEQFAREHGLVVVQSSLARRSVFLSGTAQQFEGAFGTKIEEFEHASGTYRSRIGNLTVPSELAEIIEGVFGIDNRPIARPHFQRRRRFSAFQALARARSFTPTELATIYDFPQGPDGAGQCIAIIELGGGFRPADIQAYFTRLGLPIPEVKAINVDGGQNAPSTPDSADSEVMLDIEVAAAVAPRARIAVYFARNTSKGFLDAITAAIHDNENKPSVISISWGNPEKSWTVQAMTSFDQAFQTAAALGITVCCAAGDAGSRDGVTDGMHHADFPASSPFVLGCGGTKLLAEGTTISSEVVWNEASNSSTGGGVSDNFPIPSYQADVGVPPSANPGGLTGRGVPDVAAVADPATGYEVLVDGESFIIGGTSAVAPLYAGLIALINQKLGTSVGFLNPLIYGSLRDQGCFRDITEGTNGAYSAVTGWDACTGWGSPVGARLLTALEG